MTSAAQRLRARLETIGGNHGYSLEKIQGNYRLSDEAKRQDMKALQETTSAAYTNEIKTAWQRGGEIQRELEAAQARVVEARERAAEGWDWARLEYASRTVPAMVSKALNPGELLAAYERADRYTRRALADTAETAIAGKWGVDAAHLVTRLKQDREALVDTDEVREAAAALETLQSETAQAYKDSWAAANASGGAVFSEGARALRQVQVKDRAINVETMPRIVYDIAWTDWEPVKMPAGSE